MIHPRRRPGAAFALLMLLLAACGGSPEPAATDSSLASAPSTVATTTTTVATTTTTVATTTTTVATTTSEIETTTSTGQSPELPEGELFTDPEGGYEVVIQSDWVPSHGVFAVGMEFWAIEEPGPFTSNVGILTQAIPSGMTIDDYLRLSIENGGSFFPDFNVFDEGVVVGSTGQRLGVMAYEGSPAGQFLRFLGVFAVRGDEAVVATLTAPPEKFDAYRAAVEPYLLTLRTLP